MVMSISFQILSSKRETFKNISFLKSNIREEFDILKSFLESKGIRTKSAVEETVNAHELFEDDEDDASVDRGSAGEDNSSEDEEYRLSNEEDSDESGSSSDNDR